MGGPGHEPATRELGRINRYVTAEGGGASTWELRPRDPAEGPTQRHCGRHKPERKSEEGQHKVSEGLGHIRTGEFTTKGV